MNAQVKTDQTPPVGADGPIMGRVDNGPLRRIITFPWAMVGVYMFCLGTVMYLAGVLLTAPRYLFGLDALLRPIAEWLVWYSGVPMVLGLCFVAADLLVFFEKKRPGRPYRQDLKPGGKTTVVLTAYNDEDSIGSAVDDFVAHPRVARVIVVSNNSTDETELRARDAGAIVINETTPGYGACVHRCYTEALSYTDTELVVLCEGDRTFRAADIDKLLAYAPHADIVNGTRTVETLRARTTQLTTFMFYGNLFVAKLLEAKHLGRGTLTDVGTTYKLIRRKSLERIMPCLNPSVNLEFNAHFLDKALENEFTLIECPITFHPRVGESKGGNTSNMRAAKVGFAMMRGVTFGWRAPTVEA